jgi:hypothetical protein
VGKIMAEETWLVPSKSNFCAFCGKMFESVFAHYKYCSVDCAEGAKARSEWAMPKKLARRLEWFYENRKYGHDFEATNEFFGMLGVRDLEGA